MRPLAARIIAGVCLARGMLGGGVSMAIWAKRRKSLLAMAVDDTLWRWARWLA